MDHSINEAIILAGGLGTRIRETIGEIPKPMAPVNGKPFLHYLFKHLRKNNIQTVILSVGYKWEMIHKEFGNEYLGIKIKYAIEEKQLGTGGGIKQALELVEGDKVYILNGDTYFNIDLQTLGEYHLTNSANLTLAAKPMKNFDRYGTIEIQEDGTVLAFNEKEPKDRGIINGGIYCMNTDALEDVKSDSFSLETAFLEPRAGTGEIKVKIFEDYFKDIGTPEDYAAFEKDFS
jgi:D-glycero-alpha-D-manno-heptose 1-phosphate guanylyltransferase